MQPERAEKAGRVEQVTGKTGENRRADLGVEVFVGADRRHATAKCGTKRGLQQRPGMSPAFDVRLVIEVPRELDRTLHIASELAHVPKLGKVADQKIGPPFGAAAKMVELDGPFGIDARPADQQNQHAMPGFHVADHDAAGQRFELARAAVPVVEAEQGGPDAGEHLARQDFFQNAAKERPFDAGGGCVRVRGIGRKAFEVSGPAVEAALGRGPILLHALAGELCLAADEYGPLGGEDGGQFDKFSRMHGRRSG